MKQVQGRVEAVSDVARAWGRVRQNLRHSAGPRLFDQWLAPMALVDDGDAQHVRLTLPSAFMTGWVRSHYAERLLHEFRAVLPDVRNVTVETVRTGPALTVVSAPAATDPQEEPVIAATARAHPALIERYTFDRFVTGESNLIAANAARAVAQPGPVRFSPLFLHGATGQGKTHLMQAIGHAFLALQPDATVLCMSAERFMYEFVAAMRAKDTHAFKTRLRGADLLLIDDLQFIAGKDATQEEFFHTVNEVMSAGKRLVIAADRSPQALEGIDARILSRMASGLVAEIGASGPELRRALLDRKLAESGEAVPAAVLELIATRITSSNREAEGALNRVIAYAQLTGAAIDLDFATRALAEQLRGVARRVTIDEIQKAVAEHFELKQLDLVSARRARAVARPRQIAMYLAKRLTTRSLPEIGRKFGGRDHSTVIHAVKRIDALRDSDREVDGAVTVLLRKLEA